MLKDIKTKPHMIKPKLLEKSLLVPREARAILISQYKKQKAEIQNQPKENDTQESPSNYAVEKIENAADVAIAKAHTNAKKILRYSYKKIKLHKNIHLTKQTNSNVQIQMVTRNQSAPVSSTTPEASEFKSRVKTKDYYTGWHKSTAVNSTPSPYHYRSPFKEKQEERIRFAKKNMVKNKLLSSERVKSKPKFFTKSQKNPIKNTVKKQLQQAKRKAQKKMVQEAAKRTVQASKAIAKVSMKLAFKAVQLTIATVKALVSAIAALGGGAILLVVLIIVIVVAAIAASPYGILISEEANEGIPVSAIVAECNQEFTQRIEAIEHSNTYDCEEVQGEQTDWSQVLAVFAVKTAGTDDDTAQDVVVIDETKKNLLKEVFWDMNSISAHLGRENGETVLYITIAGKTSNDMVAQYNFTAKQREALSTLLENSDVLLSATRSLVISDAAVIDVLNKLPQTLSPERKSVVKAACSLVGKVNYFWGGKSSAIGWDNNWGKMTRVTADESSSTGTIRPFGLDCSGFVAWAFINAGISGVGDGTQGQNASSTHINWNNAQAGDLAFYSDLSHVGIVVGKDADGNIFVIHCNSSANNVSLTTDDGFGFCARPSVFN